MVLDPLVGEFLVIAISNKSIKDALPRVPDPLDAER